MHDRMVREGRAKQHLDSRATDLAKRTHVV